MSGLDGRIGSRISLGDATEKSSKWKIKVKVKVKDTSPTRFIRLHVVTFLFRTSGVKPYLG